jgi:hypothetical protein
MTAQDIVTRSLTLISRLGAGRTPGASESTAAFGVLNAMLASWSTDRLTVYSIQTGIFAVTAATQTYTIGTGGTWNTARPIKISGASVIVSIGGVAQSFPLKIVDNVQWTQLLNRNDSSPIPRYLYNDYAYPSSNISLSPIPVGTPSIELHSYVPLAQFAALTDTVAFPQGYERAIAYNLAVELAPMFELKPPDAVLLVAKDSKEALAQLNAKISGADELADPRAK